MSNTHCPLSLHSSLAQSALDSHGPHSSSKQRSLAASPPSVQRPLKQTPVEPPEQSESSVHDVHSSTTKSFVVPVEVVKGEVDAEIMSGDVWVRLGEEEEEAEGDAEANGEAEEEDAHLLREPSESNTQMLFSQNFVTQSVEDKQKAHSPWKHLFSEPFDPSTHFAL